MTRSVDHVDDVILPAAADGGGGDGDATLSLLPHPVRQCGAVLDISRAGDHARQEEDALSERRLARVNMRGDPDVPEVSRLHDCARAPPELRSGSPYQR
jgi:hypothetical protein